MTRYTPPANVTEVVQILRQHKLRWVIPTIAFALLSLGYVCLRSPTWEASQAMIVRDESNSKPDRPGRFVNPEDMKTLQETILEMAKSRAVVAAALKQVGPANEAASPDFPNEKEVAAMQGAVKITPPKGLEFGKTEVFYLKVQANSSARALALSEALCSHLQEHFAELRNDKSQSLVNELTKTVDLAQQDLNGATARLSDCEQKIGSDLAELRMLNDSPAGDSDLRHRVTEIENELRQARVAQQNEVALLNLLLGTQNDPNKFLATPGKLLDSQPALRRLKDGLVEAELRTAQLGGTVSPNHPLFIAAKVNEAEVQQQLRAELTLAIQGLQVEHTMSTERIAVLDKLLGEARGRMKTLATIRASYGNLVADVRQRTDILKNAQQSLAEARANLAGSHVASMITRIDTPDVGSGPVGPGRSQTVLLGTCCGLILGLGIVFLTVPGRVEEMTESSEQKPSEVEQSSGLVTPTAIVPVSRTPSFADSPTPARDAFVQPSPLTLKEALRKLTPIQNNPVAR